jgi:hypothetical protein
MELPACCPRLPRGAVSSGRISVELSRPISAWNQPAVNSQMARLRSRGRRSNGDLSELGPVPLKPYDPSTAFRLHCLGAHVILTHTPPYTRKYGFKASGLYYKYFN